MSYTTSENKQYVAVVLTGDGYECGSELDSIHVGLESAHAYATALVAERYARDPEGGEWQEAKPVGYESFRWERDGHQYVSVEMVKVQAGRQARARK